MVRNYIKPVVSVMEMPPPHGPTIPCYSIVPQASHLMSGGKIKSPGAITLRGLFLLSRYHVDR